MSDNRRKADAPQSNGQAGHVLTEQFDAATIDVISENSPFDGQLIAQSRQVIQSNQAESTARDWDDNASVELTQAQVQRLSLAVDRILGTHQMGNSIASNLKSESVAHQEDPNPFNSPFCPFPTPFGAESRVQEELSRALPDEPSPETFPVSSHGLVHYQANTGTRHENPSSAKQSLEVDHHFPQEKHQKHNSDLVLVSSVELSSGFNDDDLELLPENSFENESSIFEFEQFDFDDLDKPVPTFDRDHPLPSVDWTYDDVLFIQSTLCSSQSNQFQQQPLVPVDWTYNEALFIQNALCSPHSHQSACLKTVDTFSSACPNSPSGSRDVTPHVISPRSSSLQHRLNLSKNSAMISGRKTRALHQDSNNMQSPTETSHSGPPSLHQIISPSSADGPDASSFPLTPPLVARSSLVGQAYIPSSPDDPYSSPNENHEVRPRGFNSRAGRPIPTTILFRDVAAQVVAANAALRKVSNVQTDGLTNCKKLHSNKKTISTAQVGAPVLLSAPAKLSELELERTVLERSTSHTDTNKDISKKSSFKLRLRKKRPSESRLSHEKNDLFDATHHDSSKLVQVDESTPTAAPTSTASFLARDSINASLIQTTKHRSADPPESHASWKHPYALTNRVRKLIGRQRKLSSNPISVSKQNPEPTSSIDSIDTSSEVALVSQVPHLQTSDDLQELGPESDTPNVWPPSAAKSLPRRSQSFNELGLSSSDTPSRDSDMDHHRDNNSLFISVISTEPSYPEPDKSEARRSLARSFPRSVPNNLSGIRPCPLESDGPTVHPESTKDNPGVDQVANTADQSKSLTNPTAHILAVPSPWFESQGSEPHSAHSDCASSILDLYGCDSQSTTASSPKRSSSASYYSNPYDLSRPISGLFPSSRIQHPQRRSNVFHIDEHNENMSSNESQLPASNILPRERNSAQNELMVMVQQLQNSTRYSEFEPTRSSLNPKEDSSTASFFKHIVQGNPNSNSFKMTNGNSRDEISDDDDEAEVWKQILKG